MSWSDVFQFTEVEGKEVASYGSLDTFGQEVAQAEPWVYLTFVYRRDDATWSARRLIIGTGVSGQLPRSIASTFGSWSNR